MSAKVERVIRTGVARLSVVGGGRLSSNVVQSQANSVGIYSAILLVPSSASKRVLEIRNVVAVEILETCDQRPGRD